MDDPIFIRPPLEDGVNNKIWAQRIRRSMCTTEEIQLIRPAPINMKRQTPESDNGRVRQQLLGAGSQNAPLALALTHT